MFPFFSVQEQVDGVSETLGIQKNSSLNGPVEFGITTLFVRDDDGDDDDGVGGDQVGLMYGSLQSSIAPQIKPAWW